MNVAACVFEVTSPHIQTIVHDQEQEQEQEGYDRRRPFLVTRHSPHVT